VTRTAKTTSKTSTASTTPTEPRPHHLPDAKRNGSTSVGPQTQPRRRRPPKPRSIITKRERTIQPDNEQLNPQGSQNSALQTYLRGPYTVTTALIAANVLVFIAMVISGVSFSSPTTDEALKFGADSAAQTIGAHQYWRLLTSTFVHFGIIHIGFNMFVLYQIGPFVQITFGRARYLIIYFIAGLAGSIVSIYIHPHAVGAGASGAIFGLYGAVFGFLLRERNVLNPAAMKSIRNSAGIFILYNIAFGAVSRTTDLSAHLGGLVAGFLAGVALVRARKTTLAP
jgi:rhomboid protease GluP